MSDNRKYVIWSDELCFTFFRRSYQVNIRIMHKEAYNSECLVPPVKHGGGSVMIWAAISWFSAGPIITLVKLLPVTTGAFLVTRVILWSRCCFLTIMQFFRMTVRSYTEPEVFCLGLRSMKMYFNILPGQPDLIFFEWLWSDLESSVRSRFSLSSLKQVEIVLHEEWYSIALETIQNLHESIPRRLQAVIQTRGGQILY